MNRRTFLSGLAAALVAANTLLGFAEQDSFADRIEDYDITFETLTISDRDAQWLEGLRFDAPLIHGTWRLDG